MPVIMKDIAKMLNVSESTVSRALANSNKISEKTKANVKKLAEELNYKPNLIAASLRIKKTKTIGLIIDDITNPFYPEIVKGCEKIANEHNLSIILCNSDYEMAIEKNYLNILISKKVDGMIMMPAGDKIEIIKLLNQNNIPLVFIDIKPLDNINVSCIYTDQEEGGYKSVKYLFKLGHKKIALVNGSKFLSSCQQLEAGYIKAMRELNLKILLEYIKECNFKYDGGYSCTKELLELKEYKRPTAALYISDITAIAGYDTVYEKGLKIPDDFSIVGNDNIPASKNLAPPLTTVEHPKYEMGVSALNVLTDIIANKNINKLNHIKFMPKLIIRKSTSTPRK